MTEDKVKPNFRYIADINAGDADPHPPREKVKPTLRYDEGDECWVLSAPPGMRLRKIVGDWAIDEMRTLICFEVAAPEAYE